MAQGTTADTPLPPDLLNLRYKNMSFSGIHTIYPLGQDYSPQYGTFNAFNHFTARVFGYILNLQFNEWAVYVDPGYVIIKFHNRKPLALLKGKYSPEFSNEENIDFWEGLHFSFAHRAEEDNNGQAWQCLYQDRVMNAVTLSWDNARVAHINNGAHRVLSTHFGLSDEYRQLPHDGLDRLLEAFVRFDVGSYLVYTGIYQGGGPIRIRKPHKAVRFLSHPPRTGTEVKVGVRITTKHFIFTADYHDKAVIAPFKDLKQDGFHFVPRFEDSFLVRYVLIESTRYFSKF